MTQTGMGPVERAERNRRLAYLIASIAAAVLLLLAVFGETTHRATARVLVSLQALQPDEAVDQFDALDQSNAMGTVVDVFASDDLWQRALASAAVSDRRNDEYGVVIENPDDSLIVTIEVSGPSDRVARVSDELARLGAETLETTFGDVDVVAVESIPPESVSLRELLLIGVVGMSAFLATGWVVLSAIAKPRDGQPTGILASIAGWIGDRDRLDDDSDDWPSRRLVVVGIALGLVSGSFVLAPIAGLAAVAGALFALAFLFALRHPRWLTVGLVLLVLFRLSDIGTDFFGFPEISIPYVFFVLGVLGVRRLAIGEIRDGWLGLGLALMALVAVMASSGLMATDQVIALDRTFDLVKNAFVALIMVALVREIGDLRAVVWTLIAGTSFLALLGIFSYWTGGVPGLLEGFAQTVEQVVDEEVVSFRIAGPIGDANFFAQMLVTIFPIAVERAWRERSSVLRAGAAIGSAVIAVAIVLTSSRGAVLGLLVCVVFLVVWLRPPTKVLVVAACALSIVSFMVPTGYLNRLGTIGQVFTDGSAVTIDPSIQGRTSELVVGIQMFHDHPLLGVGPGNYPGRYLDYSPALGLDYRAELRQPHSLPVEVAAELGVLGLTWWFLGLVVLGRALWRARKLSRSVEDDEMADHLEALTVALIGFMVTALFLHLDFARFFWMLVGVVVAAIRIARLAPAELEPEQQLAAR
jgi:putative inorganic carbon (HCO3(-)) transporter